jgi:hypothetical protein
MGQDYRRRPRPAFERYAELCRKNLAPLLGGLMLTKLQLAHISQAYAKALVSGRGAQSAAVASFRRRGGKALREQSAHREPLGPVRLHGGC